MSAGCVQSIAGTARGCSETPAAVSTHSAVIAEPHSALWKGHARRGWGERRWRGSLSAHASTRTALPDQVVGKENSSKKRKPKIFGGKGGFICFWKEEAQDNS